MLKSASCRIFVHPDIAQAVRDSGGKFWITSVCDRKAGCFGTLDWQRQHPREEFLLFLRAARSRQAIAHNAVIARRIMGMNLLDRKIPDLGSIQG